MSDPWWGQEATRSAREAGTHTSPARPQPELLKASRDTVAARVLARVPSYTREWTSRRRDDAGQALVKLFGEQMEPVLQRLDRVPDKLFVEALRTAGVQPLPPRPATVMLEFVIAPAAKQSQVVNAGFQVAASPATGTGDLVVFETTRELIATPAKIAEVRVQSGSSFIQVDVSKQDPTFTFVPFAKEAKGEQALLLGLSTTPGDSPPFPQIAIAFNIAPLLEVPSPIELGGVAPLPVAPSPLLVWELLDGGSFQPVELVLDETNGLRQSGVVVLRLPRSWRPDRPPGLEGKAQLRWLRLRLLAGTFERAPTLSIPRLNAVPATATRTFRDEALQPLVQIGIDPSNRVRQMSLTHTPLIPDSLVVEIDEGTGGQAADVHAWTQVDNLFDYGPDDRVYLLDPENGIITFGDGIHGATVPPGFRNVIAKKYAVSSGAASAVGAGEVKTLVNSAPFIIGVTNFFPASGGDDAETRQAVLARGPQEIRARGRAVTLADYELLAQRAPGARVRRAHAMAGLHPAHFGKPIPGVVGVLVVPPDPQNGQPPIPDEGSLRAVASFLSAKVAPVGVTVVAAAAHFHRVRAEANIVIAPDVDVGATVNLVLTALDNYLHPLTGGDDGTGWPFGGTLRFTALLLRLSAVPGVRAVQMLNLVVDGIRTKTCSDVPILPHDLFWPGNHEIFPLSQEEAS